MFTAFLMVVVAVDALFGLSIDELTVALVDGGAALLLLIMAVAAVAAPVASKRVADDSRFGGMIGLFGGIGGGTPRAALFMFGVNGFGLDAAGAFFFGAVNIWDADGVTDIGDDDDNFDVVNCDIVGCCSDDIADVIKPYRFVLML